MSEMEPWTRQLLSVIVSQLCKTIGWHSVSTTCLQILVDVLHRYLKQLGTSIHDYTEHYNHTFPAIEELFLAFSDMGINVEDLKEYVDYVTPITIKERVPKYPLEKKSNLNFLKPGSREVVTRPVHVHEHLPAMYPDMSDDYSSVATSAAPSASSASLPSQDNLSKENSSCLSLPSLSNVIPTSNGLSSATVFKKPGEKETTINGAAAVNKHIQRLISEEIGRPLRELSCVMMTTSGFLSPAREGKAPEARVPKPLINFNGPGTNNSNSSGGGGGGGGGSGSGSNNNDGNAVHAGSNNVPSNQPAAAAEVKNEHKKHSHSKSSKSLSGEKKLREDAHHNNRVEMDEPKPKKVAGAKETSKLRATFKPLPHKSSSSSNGTAEVVVREVRLGRPPKHDKTRIPPSAAAGTPKEPKMVTPKSKPEKGDKIPQLPPPALPPTPVVAAQPVAEEPEKQVEKLTTEPSREKLNIFKRFTKVKEERAESPASPQTLAAAPTPSPKNNHHHHQRHHQQVDKNAQINECIEAVIKRSREKEELDIIPLMPSRGSGSGGGVREHFEPVTISRVLADPPPEPHAQFPSDFAAVLGTTLLAKSMKRRKKPKLRDFPPTIRKKLKLNRETTIEPVMPARVTAEHKKLAKTAAEPEPPPPYSFFGPGVMPPSLSQNLLIPRFMHNFMPITKMTDANGPHPEMPDLPLPPPNLMQPPLPPPPQPADGNHKFLSSSSSSITISAVAPSPAHNTKKSGAFVDADKKHENNTNAAAAASAVALSDKKLKKKMKKDKREKDKKKREKKEKLKNKEKLQKKKEQKKDLKKLKVKKEKLKKKEKLAAAAATARTAEVFGPPPAQQQPTSEDPSVPKLKLKLGGANSPQLSPSAGCTASGGSGSVQSPKIVIKPVLKPAEETFGAAAAAANGSASTDSMTAAVTASPPLPPPQQTTSSHRRDERESTSSPELAKIAYISKPPKQKNSNSSSRNSSHGHHGADAAASTPNNDTAAAGNHHHHHHHHHHNQHAKSNNVVAEPVVAPITLTKSCVANDKGSTTVVEIKAAKPVKEKSTKGRKSKMALAAAAAAATAAATAAAEAARAAPPPPHAAVAKPKPAAFYYDADGNQVWVCPACGAQDDGTPMIGCDGCDAWYHWVCVGIKSAPDTAKWFCDTCALS